MALYLFLGLSIALVSCSGEDGKDGIDGEMGLQGPAGQDGADGQDGNANVIVSDWMQIVWDDVNSDNPPTIGEMYIEEIPGIDDMNAFLETEGVVLVYLRRTSGFATITTLLPYDDDFYYIYAYTSTTTDPNFFNNALVIRGESVFGVTEIENNDSYMVKYVVVPANIAQANDLTNNMPKSFGEAATLFGLNQ
ncbi:hypothetical protein [Flagellimonas sp.]|uniref:hypothetical protein n=1 Tax=Flagellimonas sp. TaxID=2058762 RepID=UPI003AB6CBA2